MRDLRFRHGSIKAEPSDRGDATVRLGACQSPFGKRPLRIIAIRYSARFPLAGIEAWQKPHNFRVYNLIQAGKTFLV
jgi:hypothetical protein